MQKVPIRHNSTGMQVLQNSFEILVVKTISNILIKLL